MEIPVPVVPVASSLLHRLPAASAAASSPQQPQPVAPSVAASQVGSKRDSTEQMDGKGPPPKKPRSRGNKTPPKKPTDDDMSGLQLSDMVTGIKEVEMHGKLVKVNMVLQIGEFDSECFTVGQLRKICRDLSIKGYKNKKKLVTLVATP